MSKSTKTTKRIAKINDHLNCRAHSINSSGQLWFIDSRGELHGTTLNKAQAALVWKYINEPKTKWNITTKGNRCSLLEMSLVMRIGK